MEESEEPQLPDYHLSRLDKWFSNIQEQHPEESDLEVTLKIVYNLIAEFNEIHGYYHDQDEAMPIEKVCQIFHGANDLLVWIEGKITANDTEKL